MKRAAGYLLLAASLAIFFPTGASAIQQIHSVAAGKGVAMAVADPVTGRVFTANFGTGRYGDGASIGVIEGDGSVSSIATSSVPVDITIGAGVRRVLVTIGGFGDTGAELLNADTLEATHVATGPSPLRGIIVEATKRAYVIGRNATAGNPFVNPVITGTLTEIDLATHESRVYQVPGMQVQNLVADPAGDHVYVIGSNYFRTAESMPGFVHVFDTRSKTLAAGPMPLGRLLSTMAVSRDGSEVYVVGHEDYVRTSYPAGDMRRNSVRPVVFVLAAGSLALKRTIELPDTKDRDLHGETLVGSLDWDLEAHRLYVCEWFQQRLTVVDLETGAQRTADIEAPARNMGYNPVTGNVVVSLPTLGQAAIFSADGERIDTVPVGTAASSAQWAGTYGVSFNPANGDTYVASGHDASLAILPAGSSEATVVNVTGLWWNPSESGWGLYLEQQGTTLFGALFTHDASGAPTWMVMSEGKRQPDGSFAGTLYRTSGPREQALANLRAVGTMRFTPASGNLGALAYEIDGVVNAESMQRERFGAGQTQCGWTSGTPSEANFTSLWFNPAEPGWGLAVTQQGDTAFGVLFGFDAQNRPAWTAMSNGEKRGGASFAGPLYRAAASGPVEQVGSMAIEFASALAGTVTYDVDGLAKASAIARQRFGALASDCASR